MRNTIYILLCSLFSIVISLSLPPRSAAAHDGVDPAHHRTPEPTTDRMAFLERQAARHPGNAATRIRLGNALMQRARETGDTGLYASARTAFQEALQLNAASTAAMTGLAWVHGARHEFQASIAWANRALALDARNADALGLLGDAAVEYGDYEAAFDHYQMMLDIRPDLAAYSRGAHLLFVTGDSQAAIRLMQKAIKAGGPYAENTVWCMGELAHIYWRMGRLTAAEEILVRGLDLAPQSHQLLALLGKVKASQLDLAAAIKAYEKALAIRPSLGVRSALADLYRHTGQAAEAARQIDQIEKYFDQHSQADLEGDIWRIRYYADRERRLPEALAAAKRLYSRYQNVFAADTLAWCYYKNGDFQNARKVIAAALRYKTADPQIWFHAGMIYWKLGERENAVQHLNHALSLNRHFDPIDAAEATTTLERLALRHPNQPVAEAL